MAAMSKITGPSRSVLDSSWLAGRCRSATTQAPMRIAADAPARTPPITAQASAGPASQVAVTGITPTWIAAGFCTSRVDITAAAVTSRSASRSRRVRIGGDEYNGADGYQIVVTTVHAAIPASTTQAQPQCV